MEIILLQQSRGAIIKMDLSGNVIWAKETVFSNGWYNSNYSIIPDVDGYVVLGTVCCGGGGSHTWLVYKISLDGNSVNLIKGVWYDYHTYKMVRDNDGNYVITGSPRASYDNCGLLTKMSPSGDILFSKKYCANNGSRIYDVAVDFDGNYLVSGTAIEGAPPNQANNLAKGVAPVKLNKFLLSGYLGTNVENHNGCFIILDSIGSIDSYLTSQGLSISVTDITLPNWTPTITLHNYTNITNLTLTPYSFELSSTPARQITPISANE